MFVYELLCTEICIVLVTEQKCTSLGSVDPGGNTWSILAIHIIFVFLIIVKGTKQFIFSSVCSFSVYSPLLNALYSPPPPALFSFRPPLLGCFKPHSPNKMPLIMISSHFARPASLSSADLFGNDPRSPWRLESFCAVWHVLCLKGNRGHFYNGLLCPVRNIRVFWRS